MLDNKENWFSLWFNTPYYHILYKNRDYNEAATFIDNITQLLNLKKHSDCWDLCCGKGRHSVYLNKKGFNVIGTDLSEQSINFANQSKNNSLEFYVHDMRDTFRINYFDAVFNLFTSFGYFDKKEDDEKVFLSVQKGLKKDGIFVFDYLNSEFVKSTLKTNDVINLDGIEFHITKKIENNTVIKNIDFTDNGKTYRFEERVKLFDKNYFENLARKTGLQIIHTFGNYKLEEFEAKKSPRLIIVLKK
jgi:SAM-dependent methyltransferase